MSSSTNYIRSLNRNMTRRGLCRPKLQLVYENHFTPGKRKNVIGESAVYGIAIHNTVQDIAKKFNCEIEKEVDGKIGEIEVRGRADLVCDDSVIEIKTTTVHDQRHYFQLAIYAKLLNLNKAYMLYIDRDTANITFFKLIFLLYCLLQLNESKHSLTH